MPSWFDLKSLDPKGPEDEDGINSAFGSIHKIIDEEINKHKIPSEKIIVGGFSQGGALALTSALRYPKRLGGVVALSCWLPLHTQYPDAALPVNRDIPVLHCHGNADPIVPYHWGMITGELMKKFIRNYEFKTYSGLGHSSNDEASFDGFMIND